MPHSLASIFFCIFLYNHQPLVIGAITLTAITPKQMSNLYLKESEVLSPTAPEEPIMPEAIAAEAIATEATSSQITADQGLLRCV